MTLDVGLVCQNVVRRDGQGRVMLELARAVAERGHRVTVYSHRLDDELADVVRLKRIPRPPGPQVLDDLFFLAAATAAVRRASHDVVCALGPMALPSSPFVLNVQFSHRGWRKTWTKRTRPRRRHRLHAALLGGLETLCARRADRVIASTDALGREVLPAASGKVAVIPNGVDAREFVPIAADERADARRRLSLGEHDFVLAFLGDLSTPRKGLEPLLRAIALGPPEERLVVASGGERSGIERELAALGIADRVVVAGFEPPRSVFAAADTVCVPSLYEPFSLVALEAAASGVPVVLSASAGAAPLLDGGAILVADPSDPLELRAALDLVRRDGERERLSAAGRRAVEGLSWRCMFGPAVSLLEDVASNRRAAEPV